MARLMIRRRSLAVVLFWMAPFASSPEPRDARHTECLIASDAVVAAHPQFDAFPAMSEKIAKPAKPDVTSGREAREYRTMLRIGARDGPNFAGHFTIAGWGCGSSCLQWAVVDAKTGHVHFEPSIDVVSAAYVGEEQHSVPGVNARFNSLRFRVDSSLLVVLGAPHEEESREGAAYYRWNGRTFSLLKFVPRKDACRNVAWVDPS